MTRFTSDPAALRTVPLFAQLTDTQLAWLLPSLSERSYPARTVVLKGGDTPDGLFVILSGRVRLVHEDGQGHELIAAEIGCQDFFGEMGLIDASPCPASVHTLQPTVVLHVPRTVLMECLDSSGAAAMRMLRTVLERLCSAHYKMAQLALTTVYGRVARVLLEKGEHANGEWLVSVGAQQIAATVGASREMVNRVVRAMVSRGAVRRYKRKLIVTDRAALAAGTPPLPGFSLQKQP